jgi:hypothetical protein
MPRGVFVGIGLILLARTVMAVQSGYADADVVGSGFRREFKRDPGEVPPDRCGLCYSEGTYNFQLRPTWDIVFRSGSGRIDCETGRYVGPWNVKRL